MDVVPKVEKTEKNGYQFTLHAATSMVGKVNHPTITYLNQGQKYRLSLRNDAEFGDNRKNLLFQVNFHHLSF